MIGVMNMKLNLTDLLYALSVALDMVEHEMIGVQSAHGKHVAYLTSLMAKGMGYEGVELNEIVSCAMLHDNAFSEYASEEFYGGSAVDSVELRKRVELLNGEEYMDFISGCKHSEAGENNIRLLPFRTNIENIILYHHENADGTGPMGKNEDETPFTSQIVHLADAIDVTENLLSMTEEEFNEMIEWMEQLTDKFFSYDSVKLFKKTVSYDDIIALQDNGSEPLLRQLLDDIVDDYTDQEIKNIALFFARIVDCKSSFVRSHSIGVAEKAEVLSKYFGFSADKCIRMYFAGALHDLGKLIIQNDVLEKRGNLTDQEFAYVKNHASATYEVLKRVKGLEDITRWASRHHEKLDGSGYPFGLTAQELSQEDRVMTCADIYQALTEPRPYKDAYTHSRAIEIMKSMAESGKIDGDIVNALEQCFGNR